MKRALPIVLCLILAFPLLVSCTKSEKTLTAVELSNLGEKYLLEMDYEQAVVYFTRVIEIEPMNTRAYIGRGNAYVFWNEQLDFAKADYEKAIEIDDLCVDGYLGVVDVYIRLGDYEKALEIAELGYEKTESEKLKSKIDELKKGNIIDSSNQVRKSTTYDINGDIQSYIIYQYNAKGQRHSWTHYDKDGIVTGNTEVDFDEKNREKRYRHYREDALKWYDTFVYNERDLKIEQYRYKAEDDSLDCSFKFEYNDMGKRTKYYSYTGDGTLIGYWVSEYDESGKLIREIHYDADGTLQSVSKND